MGLNSNLKKADSIKKVSSGVCTELSVKEIQALLYSKEYYCVYTKLKISL